MDADPRWGPVAAGGPGRRWPRRVLLAAAFAGIAGLTATLGSAALVVLGTPAFHPRAPPGKMGSVSPCLPESPPVTLRDIPPEGETSPRVLGKLDESMRAPVTLGGTLQSCTVQCVEGWAGTL